MVEAKCRALTAAARWNGQADQNTTGMLSAKATQPQCGNWAPGIIEMMNTGMVRMAAVHRRGRSSSAVPPCAMWSSWSA